MERFDFISKCLGAARRFTNGMFPFVSLIGLIGLTGCATADFHRNSSDSLSGGVEVSSVPFYPQQTRQCGPAALAMALNWSGLSIRPDDLVEQIYSSTRMGSLTTDMIGATRRQGRVAYPITNPEDLFEELDAGHPVIVLQDLGVTGFPVWHYAVVIGYDPERKTVLLHSGSRPRMSISWPSFRRSWERSGTWGLLVLPPAELPATAEEKTFLRAVLGLERTQRWRAAEQAYAAAHKRWSGSFVALMGLGNSRFAQGDWPGAEEAFRKAVPLSPSPGPALNNLAQVLAKRKR